MRPRILVVDDEPDFIDGLARVLGEEYRVAAVGSGRTCVKLIERDHFDLILLDLKLPDMGGLAVLRRIRQHGHHVPVIVMTAYGGVDSAVTAIRLGAAEYVEKPFDAATLKRMLIGSLARQKGFGEVARRHGIVGECPKMRALWREVETYSDTDLPILLEGRTGTGKGLLARAIHDLSAHARSPFVRIDCGGLPESLIESELFGHVRGAFTGAVGDKPGQVEWAEGGTLLLDDVTETPLPTQVKLLRFLEDRVVTPVGAKQPSSRPVDVRIVSATNRCVENALEEGRLREDLYYRLAGVRLRLPPLRERAGDVERLARHLVGRYRVACGKPALELSTEALQVLEAHSWPGNVRELEHVLRAAAAAADTLIMPSHLPAFRRAGASGSVPRKAGGEGRRLRIQVDIDYDLSGPIDLKEVKARAAEQAELQVIAHARRVTTTITREEFASFLGICPKTLRRKLRALGGEPKG